MRLIVFQRDVRERETVDVGDHGIELHCWKRKWRASQLFSHLVKVISVYVHIAEGVDEFPCGDFVHLRNHE